MNILMNFFKLPLAFTNSITKSTHNKRQIKIKQLTKDHHNHDYFFIPFSDNSILFLKRMIISGWGKVEQGSPRRLDNAHHITAGAGEDHKHSYSQLTGLHNKMQYCPYKTHVMFALIY